VGTRCRVSYLDSRNVEHAVDVTADSLFEAAAVAIRAFREGALVEELPVAGVHSCALQSFRCRSSTEFAYNGWNSGLKPVR
jgi:hypothetical protein